MAQRKYRVLAEETVVHGHRRGEEFEADLEEEGINEAVLVEGGFLEVVNEKQEKGK